MRGLFFRILFISFSLVTWVGCDDGNLDIGRNQKLDSLNQNISAYTLNKGELIALVDNSLSSYFIYKGEPKGFEFEMLKLFADQHNLELRIKMIDESDAILDSLEAGMGDLAAANLTVTEKRKERVNFTVPLFQTRQVLVQRLPENHRSLTADQIAQQLISDPIQLDGKDIMIKRNSSYEERLVNFRSETGTEFNIIEAPKYLVTENLIEMVSEEKINYTVCDENKAKLICPSFSNIDCTTPISFSQNIGWAVRKGSIKLLDSLNNWIEKEKGSKEYNMIIDDYFEARSKIRRNVRKDFKNITEGQISDYDQLIKENAKQLGWDWKLLAALIYQESGFNPNTRSWAGAVGLMQLMPTTAKSHGVDTHHLTTPEKNLQAGTAYLEWLQRQWSAIIDDSVEVLKFTLASYNAGLGHVSDARRMAKKSGMNPDKWDNSVEQMLLLKTKPEYYSRPEVKYGYCRGSEPVNYVREIFENYKFYVDFQKTDYLSYL